MAGHVRSAALGLANWANGRLKVLRVQPALYLHWPRVLGYIVAPLGLWVLIIWGVASFVRWVF